MIVCRRTWAAGPGGASGAAACKIGSPASATSVGVGGGVSGTGEGGVAATGVGATATTSAPPLESPPDPPAAGAGPLGPAGAVELLAGAGAPLSPAGAEEEEPAEPLSEDEDAELLSLDEELLSLEAGESDEPPLSTDDEDDEELELLLLLEDELDAGAALCAGADTGDETVGIGGVGTMMFETVETIARAVSSTTAAGLAWMVSADALPAACAKT